MIVPIGKQQKAYRKYEQGTVFLFALVFLVVMLILGASLIERAQNDVYRQAVKTRSGQSFHLAEAGINLAMWKLSPYEGWTTYEGEHDVSLGNGRFDVTVSPNASSRNANTLLQISARGYFPTAAGTDRLPHRLVAVISRRSGWPFGYALASNSYIDVGNAIVDSYRSQDGTYGGSNIYSNADIAVNATSFSSGVSGIAVGSNGVVSGNLWVGTGTTIPSTATNVQGSVSGTTFALNNPITIDPTIVPPNAINLGAINLSGNQTLTLTSGTYQASSISITGTSATIYIQGNVTIYVTGDIYVAGNGIVNADPGKPGNFTLYGTSTCTSVQIKGSSSFYGVVYAPSAQIIAQGSTQSGEIFGALVGARVKLEGLQTRFHYDESLRDPTKAGIQVRSWQEL